MKPILPALLLSVMTISCDGLHKEHITGNYYLVSTDYVDEDLSVSYDLGDGSYIGVVNETVFAVGYNKDFIIAKQHPAKEINNPDKSITNYFIVPITNKVDKWPDENKIGPLTELEFLIKRKELNIPEDLTFTNEIDNPRQP